MKKRHSHSSVSDYLTCPRLYFLKQLERAEPDPTADRFNLDLGSAVHDGIEASWLDDEDPVGSALGNLDRTVPLSSPVYMKARAMLRAYIPMLGIHTELTAVVYKGAPLIEHYYRVPLPNGATFSGKIDAVVHGPDGVTVIDWKTRKYHAPLSAVRLDAQLYLYEYVVREHLGIDVDAVAQVQMLTTPPAVPGLTKDGKPSRSMGKTTEAAFVAALLHHDLDPAEYVARFTDKIVAYDHFLRWSHIQTGNYTKHLDAFMHQIDRLSRDKVYPPVYRSNTCKWCDYQAYCLSPLDNSVLTGPAF